MPTYAIGDIQGCFAELKKLLALIDFDNKQDTLWFTGDLVNRGPDSLQTLRFIKELGDKHRIVLGNHDLHLLAVAEIPQQKRTEDTLDFILQAPDSAELLAWLSNQPLIQHDASLGFTMVHAGLAPNWDLATALRLAHEVAAILKSPNKKAFFQHMYGNQPNYWDEALTGWDRLRCITNYFTRARMCHPDGSLNLSYKGSWQKAEKSLVPWFRLPHRKTKNIDILFGHWAALEGVTDTLHTYALDTGCVWGRDLTAMRLEDRERFSVSG